MHIVNLLAGQTVEPPSLEDQLMQELLMLLGLLAYWPYILAATAVALTIRLIADNARTRSKPQATAVSEDADSSENLCNLQDLVRYFLDEMREAGNPGKTTVSTDRIIQDRDRGAYWGYTPVAFNFSLAGGGWQIAVSTKNYDWRAPQWQEVVIIPTAYWAVLGGRYRTVHIHGEDFEIGVAAIEKGNLTGTGTIEKAIVEAVAQAIEKLLKAHKPTALSGFHALRTEQLK